MFLLTLIVIQITMVTNALRLQSAAEKSSPLKFFAVFSATV